MIIWLTGQTGSGKSVLAQDLEHRLDNSLVIDGDNVRAIWHDLGFLKVHREENCMRVARLARWLSRYHDPIIVSVIAPFRKTRDKITEMFEQPPVFWVWMNRDLPIDAQHPYESPPFPDMILFPDRQTVEEEAKLVIERSGI